MGVRRWLTKRIIAYLQRPLPHYELRTPNDLETLKRNLRRCDVVLVDGEQRISAIIRYMTQSSWSHSALYIGDELVRRGGRLAEEAREEYGSEAHHLIVEALPEGVIAAPLAKYAKLNLRVCRPRSLRREDAKVITDEAIATLGWRYDLRNVFDLARYLIPARLVPYRFREAALHFGSGRPTEVICSSLIGRLFQGIGFPILPTRVEGSATLPQRPPRLLERVLGYRSRDYTGLFRMRHPTLLTPRDFDLSPYFDVIKVPSTADSRLDYRRIHWIREGEEPAQPERGEERVELAEAVPSRSVRR